MPSRPPDDDATTPFSAPAIPGTPALTRYQAVKRYVVERVASGEWAPDSQLPTEHELVARLGVSRMTVHRALRELSMEGIIYRRQGLGSFVAAPMRRAASIGVVSIAGEIASRGNVHSASVATLEQRAADADAAALLGLAEGDPVFRSVLVHCENDVPVQVEDRLVNPRIAPGYLAQDFQAITPYQYLSGVAPLTDAEHAIEAVTAEAWEAKLLGISRAEPCLLMRRRTWRGASVVTFARLVYPGSRYRIEVPRAANLDARVTPL